MLPFQFFRPPTLDTNPSIWKIHVLDADVEAADLTAYVTMFSKVTRNGNDYYTYNGNQIPDLNLAPGCYYAYIEFPDVLYRYTAEFIVPSNSFTLAQSGTTKYLKLEWWNDSDMAPIFYNDAPPNGRPSLVNTAYLDTYVSGSDPEVVIESEPDGVQEQIRTFQKYFVPHKIFDLVSESMIKALMIMQIHDHIVLTLPYGERSGEIQNVVVTQTQEADYALHNVEITFHENPITKTNCKENMT